ncbi:hypothetical protein F4778DRAFT_784778 [Xylariomycetidae sp. FL2044]|nr:hypothetical protein F4778DRAFT_784778 [Xylariomycetidae sp. FL2044]
MEYVMRGGSLRDRATDGAPMFHQIIHVRPVAAVVDLVKRCPRRLPGNMVDARDNHSRTSLANAARSLARQYVDGGSLAGTTPDEIRTGAYLLFDELLRAGANVDVVRNPGSGLEEPISPPGLFLRRRIDLRNDESDREMRHIVALLIHYGASIKIRCSGGYIGLHGAFLVGARGVAILLTMSGADVLDTTDAKDTVIHMCFKKKW